MRIPQLILAAACLVILAAIARGQTTAPTTRPASFVISVWQQPPESVDKWRDRGVNTFMGATDNGGTMSKAQWEAAMVARKANFITYAGADVEAEAKQPGRIGWHQLDESDTSNHVDKPGNTPAEHRAVYNRTRSTGLPMYTTLAAFDNEWYDGFPKPLKSDGSKYGHRASTGGWMDPTDVVGWDFYLWTNNRGGRFDVWERLMDRAHVWSGGKPQLVFIETNTQGKNLPFTADQFESEVWKAVDYTKAKGYKLAGVCYFSHKIYPGWTSFDNTSPEVAERMKVVNAKLVELYGKPGDPPNPPATQPAPDPVLAAKLAAIESRLDADRAALADRLRDLDHARPLRVYDCQTTPATLRDPRLSPVTLAHVSFYNTGPQPLPDNDNLRIPEANVRQFARTSRDGGVIVNTWQPKGVIVAGGAPVIFDWEAQYIPDPKRPVAEQLDGIAARVKVFAGYIDVFRDEWAKDKAAAPPRISVNAIHFALAAHPSNEDMAVGFTPAQEATMLAGAKLTQPLTDRCDFLSPGLYLSPQVDRDLAASRNLTDLVRRTWPGKDLYFFVSPRDYWTAGSPVLSAESAARLFAHAAGEARHVVLWDYEPGVSRRVFGPYVGGN